MKDLLQLMHDTVSKIATINASVYLLKSGKLSKEANADLLKAIETRANELQIVLDNFYKNNTQKNS